MRKGSKVQEGCGRKGEVGREQEWIGRKRKDGIEREGQ